MTLLIVVGVAIAGMSVIVGIAVVIAVVNLDTRVRAIERNALIGDKLTRFGSLEPENENDREDRGPKACEQTSRYGGT